MKFLRILILLVLVAFAAAQLPGIGGILDTITGAAKPPVGAPDESKSGADAVCKDC